METIMYKFRNYVCMKALYRKFGNKNVKTTIVLDSLDNGITPNQLVDTFKTKCVSHIIHYPNKNINSLLETKKISFFEKLNK